jgi:hypothetical protein
MPTSSAGRIATFAFVAALAGSIPGHAEIISVAPAAQPDPPASPALPTVLRGSPPSTASPVPICPPGFTLSPDFGSGCVGPSPGDYSEGSPGYDYWPDYGFGYPFGGFGLGTTDGRRLGSHGGRRFHHRAGVHGVAKTGSARGGAGHMGGFGRR